IRILLEKLEIVSKIGIPPVLEETFSNTRKVPSLMVDPDSSFAKNSCIDLPQSECTQTSKEHCKPVLRLGVGREVFWFDLNISHGVTTINLRPVLPECVSMPLFSRPEN